MILNETFALADGGAIPKLGLGTWRIDDVAVEQVVREATAIGYRQFDTAQAYGNERGVGAGLRASGVPRDDLFITTKLAAESKSYADAKRRIDGSSRICVVMLNPRFGRCGRYGFGKAMKAPGHYRRGPSRS